MGAIALVRCPKCGYESSDLFGIGGDCGMMDNLVVTVVCPKNALLVDTNAASVIGAQDQHEYVAPPYRPGPCPKGNCRSRTHPAWDPETAMCPVCGNE